MMVHEERGYKMMIKQDIWGWAQTLHWLAFMFVGTLAFFPVQTKVLGQGNDGMRPINLMDHYSRTIGSMPPHEFWGEVPDGLADYEGVPFDCRGILELTGMTGFDDNNIRTAHIGGIPIVDRCDVIHLLSCTTWLDQSGVVIARMVIRYEDGEMEEIPIAQVVHTDKFWQQTLPDGPEVSPYPNVKNVWSNPSKRYDSVSLNLYRASFANPRPEALIESIDFESTFSQSMPVILGLTIEKNPTLRESVLTNQASEPEMMDMDANVGEIIRVLLLDEDGRSPVQNAVVSARARVAELQLIMGTYQSDKTGIVPLRLPQRPFVAVDIEVSANGYAPVKKTITRDTSGLPDDYTVMLEKGNPIGGLVEDEVGNPIAGASVYVDVVMKDAGGNYYLSTGFPVPTDENGTWSHLVELSPESDLTIRVEHEDFMAMQYELPPSRSPYTLTRKELRDRIALMVMLPAPKVEGTILSGDGATVSDARINVLDPVSFQRRTTVRSDKAGRFDFTLTHEHPVLVMIQKQGYAPYSELIATKSGANMVQITLGNGKILKRQVVDQKQNGISSAMVELLSWNGQSLVEWSGYTDAEGFFEWNGAPDGRLDFRIIKDGFKEASISIQTDAPVEPIRMQQLPHIFGRVVDKETGASIDRFLALPGMVYPTGAGGEHINWADHLKVVGREGTFHLDPRQFRGQSIKIKISAPDYKPMLSDLISGTEVVDVRFELSKAENISGVVRSNNDAPVANVKVVAVPNGQYYSYVSNHSPVRGFSISFSDSNGVFRLDPQLDEVSLVFIHDSGFTEVGDITKETLSDIRLRPWGSVEGVLKTPEKLPWPHQETVYLSRSGYVVPGSVGASIHTYLQVQTDTLGNFLFSKVPPGEYQVGRMYQTDGGMTPMSHGIGIGLSEAEKARVIIGGEGSLVKGSMKLIGEEWPEIQWDQIQAYLVLHVDHPNLPKRPEMFPGASQDQMQVLFQEYAKKVQAFWVSEEGRSMQRSHRQYLMFFEADGSFYAEDVPDGEYKLQIHPVRRGAYDPGLQQTFNKFNSLTTYKVASEKNETEVDLGELEFHWDSE